MELWDLYTRHRKYTGREHVRGERLPEGCFHLAVHVWIRNEKDEYLISQRAADRPTFPLYWECVGGAVQKGETSLEGAVREVEEEVGIQLRPEEGKKIFSKVRGEIKGRVYNDILDVWLFEYNGEADPEGASTNEVAQCKWMNSKEIKKLLDDGELVDSLKYFFSVMDAPEPDYSGVIGKTVAMSMDRPLGSTHPKKKGLIYSVNYGYVKGILGGDGAWQDAYLLGVDEPVKEFTGQVIAVFHRFDDVEDKWIVAADGMNFSDEEILGEIYFVEQFFNGKLYR